MAVAAFFDIDQRDLDTAAALGSRLERGDIHVIRDAKAEIAVIETHIGDDGVCRIVGKAAPDPGVKIDRIGLVGTGGYLPGAPDHIFPGARLVNHQTADIDGACRSGDGEETAPMKGQPGRDIDGVLA